jgi:hypothetical protein
MGVGDPEIDCERCLRWMWWIDGDGCGMCGKVLIVVNDTRVRLVKLVLHIFQG